MAQWRLYGRLCVNYGTAVVCGNVDNLVKYLIINIVKY